MGNQHLNTVLERVDRHAREGELPVVVFDLDSTLFSTNERHLRILNEFAEAEGASWPGLREAVGNIGPHDFTWDVRGPLKERGLADPALSKALIEFWKERFFHDHYVIADKPLPGAVDFVSECHDLGAMIYYLTGRHVADMGAGTVQSITDAGFPFWRGRTTLHLKPAFDIEDREYKEQALHDIRSYHGPVVATFENEPENANLFLESFDDALHFLLQTTHSPKPVEPHPELIRIPDFKVPGRS